MKRFQRPKNIQMTLLYLLVFSSQVKFVFPSVAATTNATNTNTTNTEAATTTTATPGTSEKKDEGKADKIDKLEDKIEQIEDEIGQKRKKERTISTEIGLIDKNVEAIQMQMEKTSAVVEGFDKEIRVMDLELARLEKDVEKQKNMLAEYIRRMSESGQEQELILLEQGGGLDEYFAIVDSYERMQQDVGEALEKLRMVKTEAETKREMLDDKRGQQKQVYLMQKDQNSSLEYEQQRKERLLQQTQEDISLLAVEKEELRKQLNALQSLGSAIGLDEAIEVARYASQKTGVRTEFLLGVLRVESNMGQNVGGGRYKTDMNPSQHDLFKKICKDLGLKAEDMPVSRRVCYNPKAKDGCGGWGGAMGPAQFMPSTWEGYKDKVAQVTGNKHPNPWNLKDALVAMGLKLSAVSGVTAQKESAERQAASMYLAGGNWQSYTWYGDRVLYYADGFERYMKE